MMVGIFPRNDTQTPETRTFDYRNSVRTWSIVTQTVCLTTATLCVGIRMYTKVLVLRTRGWEDFTCFVAWLGLIAYAVISLEMDKHGNGIHISAVAPDDYRQYRKLANASQIFYAPLIFITKLSIFLLYLRVFAPTRQGKTHHAIHTLIWFNLAFYLANFFLKVFQCTPRHKIWIQEEPGSCININIPILVTAAINVLSDLLMLSLPIICVWRLHMGTRLKMGISSIFAAGVFGCFASIMRLQSSIRNRATGNKTEAWYDEILWTTAEITCAIIASCLPAFPTFFRTFSSKVRSFSLKPGTGGAGDGGDLSRTRVSDFSIVDRSLDKCVEADMYSLSKGRVSMPRGRRNENGSGNGNGRGGGYAEPEWTKYYGSGYVNGYGYTRGGDKERDKDEVFAGLTYAAEAKAERSRTRVVIEAQCAPYGDGNRTGSADDKKSETGILKTVEVDVESGPGSPRTLLSR
ncbi:hypothetical protein BDV19DRAFT_385984 [Aspergillus venezuelensis]